jgi:hypothetical protein
MRNILLNIECLIIDMSLQQPQTQPEPEDCLEALDEWIKIYKDIIYDENIKSPTNDSNVLMKYTDALEGRAYILLKAIDGENTEKLSSLGWPDTLMDCIRDPNTKILILNEIKQWFVVYPFVKSRFHIHELENENSGVN